MLSNASPACPHTCAFAVHTGTETLSVKSVSVNGEVVPVALAGDNVDVTVGGVDESALRPGQVLTWPSHPIPAITRFKAQIATLPGMEFPMVAGQQFVLHTHVLEEPAVVTRLLRTLSPDGHTHQIKPRCLTSGQTAVVRIRVPRHVALEMYADQKRLGRFMLRYSGTTVAAGMVLKLAM